MMEIEQIDTNTSSQVSRYNDLSKGSKSYNTVKMPFDEFVGLAKSKPSLYRLMQYKSK